MPFGQSTPAIRDLDMRSATRDMADKIQRQIKAVQKEVDRLQKELQDVAEEIKAGKELLKKGTDDETAQKTEENMKDAKKRRAKIEDQLDSEMRVWQYWINVSNGDKCFAG